MADYEVTATGQLDSFIQNGPKMQALIAKDPVGVDPAADSLSDSWISRSFLAENSNYLVVAIVTGFLVFSLVLSVFMAYRERVRRYVTGQNRRVGSVYYVRPGIAATQPTDLL